MGAASSLPGKDPSMKIDVFIRTMTGINRMRYGMFAATMERWKLDPNARIHFLVDKHYREARFEAEALAKSDPYLFSDDDVLIHGKNWIEKGTRVMLAHPEYGAASTKSLIVNESPFDTQPEQCDIFEVRCVGAPLWMRKGILQRDLPEYLYVSECIEVDNYMRKKGLKQGIINGIFHIHIGHGFSTTPEFIWGF
jgi:hypothetical protein